jgi:hypothetical protein
MCEQKPRPTGTLGTLLALLQSSGPLLRRGGAVSPGMSHARSHSWFLPVVFEQERFAQIRTLGYSLSRPK